MIDSSFGTYLDEIRRKLSEIAPIASEKEINYGYQFVVRQGMAKVNLNVYNGKKGRRMVWSGDTELKGELEVAVAGNTAAPKKAVSTRQRSLHGVWAGSDESGKGDFFGSLVVAAVVADATTAEKLAAAGVKDCKLITDKKILELEDVIKATVVDYSVLELKPQFYNMRYEQVAAQGGKLNQLLGYGHVAALSKVLERHPECDSALIDQFTTSDVNIVALKARFPKCHVQQKPRAESDLAVAAASVLARAQFLRTMTELAASVGRDELPKGGGEYATACARELAREFGRPVLRNFVKLHFANYSRI